MSFRKSILNFILVVSVLGSATTAMAGGKCEPISEPILRGLLGTGINTNLGLWTALANEPKLHAALKIGAVDEIAKITGANLLRMRNGLKGAGIAGAGLLALSVENGGCLDGKQLAAGAINVIGLAPLAGLSLPATAVGVTSVVATEAINDHIYKPVAHDIFRALQIIQNCESNGKSCGSSGGGLR